MSATSPSSPESTRPELHGHFGMVTSTHWLASAVGMGILERGGNAFDAGVAVGFTLQVVEPHLNGPGGEVPIILQPADGPVQVLCGQGPAPAAATPQAFDGLDRIPGAGVRAACVPGAFDAWMLLLRDHGTMPLREVLSPAIGYARRGAPVVAHIATAIEAVAPVFEQHWPSSARTWMPQGRPPRTGELLRNAELADTYQRLLEDAEAVATDRQGQIDAARRLWSQGFVAEAIGRFAAGEVPDPNGRPERALIDADDVARWTARYEEPFSVDYEGYTVHKTGPWGQGPVFLQQLRLLEKLSIGEVQDPRSAEFVHRVTEAAKLAFADREAWYADPDFVSVPMAELLSADYAALRAALVGEQCASELRPGSPAGRDPYVVPPRLHGDTELPVGTSGEPTMRFPAASETRRPGDTCHFDVVDSRGNMVSATPSGGWLSSSPVIPGLGFPLGTRGQMFWLDDRAPGVIAPGKRPRTTLSPTLATRDGRGVLAFGTPGGDQQDQWTLSFFLRVVHGGMNLQQAIEAPAFHNKSFPSSFYPREMSPGELVVESRMSEAEVEELRRRGHKVTLVDPWSQGRLTAVARDPETGLLRAASDPRRTQGYAAGR